MKLSEIDNADTMVLASLYVAVFSSPPWSEHWKQSWARDRIESIIQSSKFFGLKAEKDGAVIAACLGGLIPFKGRSEYQLVEFFVDENHQRSGIGSHLLHALEEQLVHLDCRLCTLLTSRTMPAHAFYATRGYASSENMVFMSKKLANA